MRSLSLLLLSGCALVDAAGEAPERLDFRASSIGGFTALPTFALVADLDRQLGPDIVVLDGNGDLLSAVHDGQLYDISMVNPGPYRAIAVGELDGVDPVEMIAVAEGRLDLFGGQTKSLDVVLDTMPSAVTTATFSSFGVPGGAVIISFLTSPTVQIIANPFVDPVVPRVITAAEPPVAVLVGETRVNGVGQGEVLVVEESSVIEAQAEGSDFTTFGRSFAGVTISHAAVGDFVADASDDLAYRREGGIAIASGSPGGLVEGATEPLFAADLSIKTLRVGFFNRDNQPDLAALTVVDDRPAIHLFLRGQGETFEEHVIPIEGAPFTFTVGDLDEDGVDDFLLTPGKEGGIDLLLSR